MSDQQEITPDLSLSRKLLKSYIIGFIFSAILALSIYGIIANHVFPNKTLYILLTVFIILFLFVQIVFFFRLNTRTDDDRWNLICFLFTLLIMAIVVSGSLWIMYNLNYNMMVH